MLNELHVRQIRADREREIAERLRVRRAQRSLPQRSVRRAVGRSIIEIGHRIAAEPQPRLARSR